MEKGTEEQMTDFSAITACGECCGECPKKKDGRCPGCLEADGRVPEWAESGRCRIHACARDHQVQFCGLCPAFPCEKLPSLTSWNPDAAGHLSALRDEYKKRKGCLYDKQVCTEEGTCKTEQNLNEPQKK